jgi:hypothetical protein
MRYFDAALGSAMALTWAVGAAMLVSSAGPRIVDQPVEDGRIIGFRSNVLVYVQDWEATHEQPPYLCWDIEQIPVTREFGAYMVPC